MQVGIEAGMLSLTYLRGFIICLIALSASRNVYITLRIILIRLIIIMLNLKFSLYVDNIYIVYLFV